MDSTGVSPSPSSLPSPIKSKNNDVTKQQVHAPQTSAWSLKTPQKPANLARRPITRRQSLRSVKEVREAAKQLRKCNPKPSVSPDPVPSVSESVVSKPKTSKPLPERYEILNKLFTSLAVSIRLLRLKQSSSTFTNISEKIETLTESRFTYSHLAQLKFILPESIMIKKRLVRDERTSCMKPELEVELDFSVVQDDKKLMTSDGVNLLMGKLFRSRLVSFWKSNPEGDEVPEFELPEPFNRETKFLKTSIATKKPSLESIQDTSFASEEQPIAASHLPPSFKRRFSKQVSFQNEETVSQEVTESTPETPIKGFKKRDLSSVNETPVKLISTPFSSSTPAQSTRPPVRGFMTPDENSVMSPTKSTPNKLTRRSSGKRSITFDTPVKSKTAPVKRVSSTDDDLYDILSDDLFSSIKEKEKKAIAEKDPAITQAKWRKQMIAALPKLFDSLWFYFQSINRSVITKDELMHMIISTRMEIVDRREVEEQLRLLQEFAPEWIYEKMAASGDLIICVNKISSSELIRTKLTEAN